VQQQTRHPFQIAKAEAMVFRAPIDTPVRTSFGVMRNRPALLIRLTDVDGTVGWGEVWCNFPSVGAEHRARLLSSVLAPLLCATEWESPPACFEALTAKTHVLGLQTGEPGPLAQVIAGVDVAIWDLVAKRAQQPLWQLLEGERTVAVYASGIHPNDAPRLVDVKAKEGYTAFKLKVGFDDGKDEQSVRQLRDHVGADAVLMVDANQAWSLERARSMIAKLEPYGLAWVEEPVAADTPWASWKALAGGTALRLAAGENLRGAMAFSSAHTEGGIRVIQPDIGKWGGFSGCLPVGRTANEQGHWFCPHWLGAGIGLRASMHLKAAVGGPGYVEVDANPNPLRDLLAAPDFQVSDGAVSLTDEPGLGVEPMLDAARPYLVPVLAE
jgi:L-alanine-DL-glutamate epimerase-like enolase superfamily enzyme